ncbi:MAG: hypothetical protein KBT36_15270, partial [Kurthia sp.]|nr:hypothetical protein [Candidatus Kurthia equi]
MINKHIDKVAHLFVSYFLLTVFSLILPLWGAIILAFLFGLGKEIRDEIKHKGFDYKDLIADLIGIIIGVIYV